MADWEKEIAASTEAVVVSQATSDVAVSEVPAQVVTTDSVSQPVEGE